MARQSDLRFGNAWVVQPLAGPYENLAYDPTVPCRHTPDQRYTKFPCSCGRTFWPPRGRGRGEAQDSPRRIAARVRQLRAMELRVQGRTLASIARELGFQTPSGVWRAIRRAQNEVHTWERFERENPRRRRRRPEPTDDELERAIAAIDGRLADLFGTEEQVEAFRALVRRALVRTAREVKSE